MVGIEYDHGKNQVPVRKVISLHGRRLAGIYNPDGTRAKDIAPGEVYGAKTDGVLVPVIAGGNCVMYPINPDDHTSIRTFAMLAGTYHTGMEKHGTMQDQSLLRRPVYHW